MRLLRRHPIALLLACVPPACSPDAAPPRPHVLLISVDTLRADRLGAYGGARSLTPVADELARNGVVFERCFATAPNTAPSHMSIMTSLYPTAHAVPNASTQDIAAGLKLPPDTTTLAEVLTGHGYQTMGIADGGNVSHAYGFDRGFEKYRSFFEGVSSKVDQAIAWLHKRRDPDRPFFLFFHTYEVHAPYLPPKPWVERFVRPYEGWVRPYCFDEQGNVKSGELSAFNEVFDHAERLGPDDVQFLKDLYDAGVAYTDHELGRLFQELHALGLAENLLVVFLSDHGEEFGEHGNFGHKQVFDEVARVPLIVNGPMLRIGRARVPEPVSLLDVMPTVLDLVGAPLPGQAQGRSLRAAWEETGEFPDRPAFAELIGAEPPPILTMLRQRDVKITRYQPVRRKLEQDPVPRWKMYDLDADPGETRNVAVEHHDRMRALMDAHKEWESTNRRLRDRYGARRVEGGDVPAAELRQLGYAGDAAPQDDDPHDER